MNNLKLKENGLENETNLKLATETAEVLNNSKTGTNRILECSKTETKEDLAYYMKTFLSYKKILCGLNSKLGTITMSIKINSPRDVNIVDTLQETSEGFHELEEQLFQNLVSEGLKKVVSDLEYNSQALIDVLVRNLFERSADVGFLSQDNEIINFLQNKEDTGLKERLESYVAKYSVYNDILIFGQNGNLEASIGEYSQEVILDNEIFDTVKNSDTFLEKYSPIDKETGIKDALMFYQKILSHEGKFLGILGLSFDFGDEMEKVFSNLNKIDNISTKVLFSSDKKVIFCSDNLLKKGESLNLDFSKEYQVIDINGKKYICSSKKPNDYEGFSGLGSLGVILLPLDIAFKDENIDNLNDDILATTSNLCPELDEILNRSSSVNRDLSRVVWNGDILSITGGGRSILRPILREINNNGNEIQETISKAIESLYITIISGYLKNSLNYSSFMIDIMDRNLYERANDCRWWALNNELKEAITNNDITTINNILSHTNSLYTVYDNIYVFDNNGEVITSSFLDETKTYDTKGIKISPEQVQNVSKLSNQQQYSVSNFGEDKVSKEITYTYFAKISDKNKMIGGIGLSFNSGEQFEKIIKDCIPEGKGNFGLFVDNNGKIISSTNPEFNIGEDYELDSEISSLKNGEGTSKIIELNGCYYILGAKKSAGYREYKTSDGYKNDIYGLSFIKVGEIKKSLKSKKFEVKNDDNYSNELVDVSSFIIGEYLYGFKSHDIKEAINLTLGVKIPGSPDTVEYNIQYEGKTIPVLDLGKIFNTKVENKYSQIIIVRTSKGLIGVLSNELNQINHFNKSSIKKVGYSKLSEGVINSDGFIFNIIDKETLTNYI